MTQGWDCSQARVALGVYVLDAIDPAERALVDAHLATCEACQAELAELADLPALLALVPAEEAIALADGLPGDHLFLADDMLAGQLPVIELAGRTAGDGTPGGAAGIWGMNGEAEATGGVIPASTAGRDDAAGPAGAGGPQEAPAPVVDLAARRRQRLARAGVVAAAAVIAGAASFGGAKLAASPAPSPSPVTSVDSQHPSGVPIGGWQTAQGANGQAVATVSFRSMGWGIQLAAKVTGVPLDTPCQMWVVTLNGSRAYAASWITDGDEGAVWYPGSAATAKADVRSFVITISGGRQIIVTPA